MKKTEKSFCLVIILCIFRYGELFQLSIERQNKISTLIKQNTKNAFQILKFFRVSFNGLMFCWSFQVQDKFSLRLCDVY